MIISRSKHRSSVEVCADCGASGQGDVLVLDLDLIVPVFICEVVSKLFVGRRSVMGFDKPWAAAVCRML